MSFYHKVKLAQLGLHGVNTNLEGCCTVKGESPDEKQGGKQGQPAWKRCGAVKSGQK